eukprot:8653202-Pyramimonas_sp.AAC.2
MNRPPESLRPQAVYPPTCANGSRVITLMRWPLSSASSVSFASSASPLPPPPPLSPLSPPPLLSSAA